MITWTSDVNIYNVHSYIRISQPDSPYTQQRKTGTFNSIVFFPPKSKYLKSDSILTWSGERSLYMIGKRNWNTEVIHYEEVKVKLG